MNKESYFGSALAGLKTLFTGMDITMGEYMTRKITEQYPENRKTQHIAERHRGTLVMKDQSKCKACGLCETACPNGTIKIASKMVTKADGKKGKILLDYQYDLGDCMFCQLCVNACNFGAIEFVKDFENATFDRNALVQHLAVAPTAEEMAQYEENAKVAAAKAAEEAKAKAAAEAKKVAENVEPAKEKEA